MSTDEMHEKLDDLYQRSAAGELLAEDVNKLAADLGANIALNVKLIPGTIEAPVVACVIDPTTGQCINYFTVPDPSGHILATILRHGSSG